MRLFVLVGASMLVALLTSSAVPWWPGGSWVSLLTVGAMVLFVRRWSFGLVVGFAVATALFLSALQGDPIALRATTLLLTMIIVAPVVNRYSIDGLWWRPLLLTSAIAISELVFFLSDVRNASDFALILLRFLTVVGSAYSIGMLFGRWRPRFMPQSFP
jgi:hypothetical protein